MRYSLIILTLALAACGQSGEAGNEAASADAAGMNLEAENFDEAAMTGTGTDSNTTEPVTENQ